MDIISFLEDWWGTEIIRKCSFLTCISSNFTTNVSK
jgi:hypothetical protein